MATGSRRYREIDAARGVAILMMVTFHAVYDLDHFGSAGIGATSGFWRMFAQATASLFLLLVGVSLTLSHSRASRRLGGKTLPLKYVRRGARIFLYGMAITAVTWLFVPNGVIVFGVLHCIGLSIILAYPLLRHRWLALPFGLACIAAGIVVSNVEMGTNLLLWLGIRTGDMYMFDYFPLLPWLGVVLLGVFLGNVLYPDGERRFRLPDPSGWPMTGLLAWMGRHSLAIYLVHQPLLVAMLMAADAIEIGLV
ncbi:MAG: heparan-alpha-glucosaminide N-acetyltransferase [Thermoplasmatota archaeon]